MPFWTFTLNELSLPGTQDGRGHKYIHKTSCQDPPVPSPAPVSTKTSINKTLFSFALINLGVKSPGWRDDGLFFWREGACAKGIRSMNWECYIEYFIDCLLAPCWPAWHAKFPARWRRHVASHQPSHPWGSAAFPVNKLAHSRGGMRREKRGQGHGGTTGARRKAEKLHTFFPPEEQHTFHLHLVGLQYENSLGQSLMSPFERSRSNETTFLFLITDWLSPAFGPRQVRDGCDSLQ